MCGGEEGHQNDNVAMDMMSYDEYPTYDSNNDWDPNNPYAGLGDILYQSDPWEQQQQQRRRQQREQREQHKQDDNNIDNENNDADDVSSVSSHTNRDEQDLLDEENPFAMLNPANVQCSASASVSSSSCGSQHNNSQHDSDPTAQQANAQTQINTNTASSLPPLPSPMAPIHSALHDTMQPEPKSCHSQEQQTKQQTEQQTDYAIPTEMNYPSYDSNTDWDPNNPYSGLEKNIYNDPWRNNSNNDNDNDNEDKEQDKEQTIQNKNTATATQTATSSSSLFDNEKGDKLHANVLGKGEQNDKTSSSNRSSSDDNNNQSLFGTNYNQPEYSNDWISDDQYGQGTACEYSYKYDADPYDCNEWNPHDPYAGLTSNIMDVEQQWHEKGSNNSKYCSSSNTSTNSNASSWRLEPDTKALPKDKTNDHSQIKREPDDNEQNQKSTTSNSTNQAQSNSEKRKKFDFTKHDKITPCTEREAKTTSCTDVAKKDTTIPQHSDNKQQRPTALLKDKRKKFDFDKMDKQVEAVDVQATQTSVIPDNDNDITKWLGGNIVKNGEIVRAPETPKTPESFDSDSDCQKSIRFKAEVTDLETGQSRGSLNPGSSTASDDSHPKDLNLHRKYDMYPVPENSVPEAAGLNFNTIVLHNRLNPSNVPEPVLSSSLDSSNIDGPYVRQTNDSNESDSKRTRFSDESTSQEGPTSKRRRFLIRAIGILVLLVSAAALTAILVYDGEGDDEIGTSEDVSDWDIDPYENEDVVSSRFRSPTAVQWNVQGQLLVSFPNATRNIYDGDDQEVHLGADGANLAVGAFDGTVHMYRWDNATMTWQREAVLEFPSVPDRSEAKKRRLSVALSGNGRRLAVGSPEVGRVYTYDYQEDNEEEPWRFHIQPILETQTNDGTGTSIALAYDGGVLAVGAPYFDAGGVNCGQIRILSHSGVAWRTEAYVEGVVLNDRVGGEIRLSADGATLISGTAKQSTTNGFESGIVWAWQRPYFSSNYVKWKLKGDPLIGLTELDQFGYQSSLSNSGRVMAVSVPGYATGVVFVFEYRVGSNDWKMRGSPIPAAGTSKPGVCLSADGSVVAVATDRNVQVFQYQAARNAANSATVLPREWVAVGTPFVRPSGSTNNKVTCSADGHVVAVVERPSADLTSTVTILKAVEL